MEPVHLFDLAARRSHWLAVRQTAIAQNIANANTPRYTAMDIEPFEAVSRKTALTLAATAPNHLQPSEIETLAARPRRSDGRSTVYSGNSVNLEQEMLKAGEVNRHYALTTNIVKSFHRMLTAAARG